MGNLGKLAEQSQDRKRLALRPEGTTVFWVLQDYEELDAVQRHTGGIRHQGAWRRFLCLNDEYFGDADQGCPACDDPREQVNRVQTRLPVIVATLKGEVRYVDFGWYDLTRISEIQEQGGDITERPLRWTRYGSGMDTKYSIKVEDPENYPKEIVDDTDLEDMREFVRAEYYESTPVDEMRAMLEDGFLQAQRPRMTEVDGDVVVYEGMVEKHGGAES